MDIAYLSALSVLTGSVIGGITSTGTTWLTQRAHACADKIILTIIDTYFSANRSVREEVSKFKFT